MLEETTSLISANDNDNVINPEVNEGVCSVFKTIKTYVMMPKFWDWVIGIIVLSGFIATIIVCTHS